MICRADTIGVFQIESRAQMSMLPRLKPKEFYDLVIEVAIVRPGPIQGNMVHPYLRRRNGDEPVTYPNEALREVLGGTLGVPLFQEQAMKLVMVAAGFTAEEADLLRRAMAAWRKSGAIEKFRPKLIDGMLKNGYNRTFAEQCFEQIRGFGEYGFPESHAASFASLVYVSAWIKRYHPAAFAAALLNSQPMGFYAPAQLVRDAQEHGVTVWAADVNESDWDCVLQSQPRAHALGYETSAPSGLDPSTWGRGGPILRLGLRLIKSLRQAHADLLVAERRRGGRFRSVLDLQQRTVLPKATLKRLAEADAFGSLGLSRREALWQVLGLEEEPAPLFDLGRDEETERRRDAVEESEAARTSSLPASGLPPMPRGLEVLTDYTTVGLSLKDHPVALVRDALRARKILPAARIRDIDAGCWVRVAGLVLIRQRPGTASGIVFETLEDETGIVNLIVRPHIYEQYRQAARHATLVEAHGIIERQGEVIHVMVKKMEDLTWLVEGLRTHSRDFH
jgi:error-prone DNA polymerase